MPYFWNFVEPCTLGTTEIENLENLNYVSLTRSWVPRASWGGRLEAGPGWSRRSCEAQGGGVGSESPASLWLLAGGSARRASQGAGKK